MSVDGDRPISLSSIYGVGGWIGGMPKFGGPKMGNGLDWSQMQDRDKNRKLQMDIEMMGNAHDRWKTEKQLAHDKAKSKAEWDFQMQMQREQNRGGSGGGLRGGGSDEGGTFISRPDGSYTYTQKASPYTYTQEMRTRKGSIRPNNAGYSGWESW